MDFLRKINSFKPISGIQFIFKKLNHFNGEKIFDLGKKRRRQDSNLRGQAQQISSLSP